MDSDFNRSHGQMYMAGERGNHLGHQKELAPHPIWQVHSRWEEFKRIKTGRNICSTQNLKYACYNRQTWVLKFTFTEQKHNLLTS
ncbi:hypothetical protein ACE6H2_012340 [Prunus campanulata]